MIDPALDRVRNYHTLSKHRLDAYAPGPGFLDWATQPNPFRRYGSCPTLTLPLLADRLDTRFNALRSQPVDCRPIDLAHVATLLELSLGLSAWKSAGDARWALRCNPSSGNLHPTEAYLVCPTLVDLQGGVYHYVSADHTLEQRCAPVEPHWSAHFPQAGFLVALSSIHWREAWKYGVRAYRYCQHDAGHALAAVRYAAAALGWGAWLLDRFGDEDVARLLGLDREADYLDAERENPEFIVWVGECRRLPDPSRLNAAVSAASWSGRANRLSTRHRDWPDIDLVATAAAKPRRGSQESPASSDLPRLLPPRLDLPAAQLFRQRRSALGFDGRTEMPAEDFFALLDSLLHRPHTPPWDSLPVAPTVHLLLFVHRVAGLTPGLYVLPRSPAGAAALRRALRSDWPWQAVPACPRHIALSLICAADVRAAAETIACHQEIAAESCFSLAMLAEFDASLARGAWWYRYLFWECGVVGQTLYLEGEAAGLRGTGIGCFFDDEMHRLLGLSDTSFQDLYHFTVGAPIEDSRLATHPPYADRAARKAE